MASHSWSVQQLPFNFSKALVPESMWHTKKTAPHVKSLSVKNNKKTIMYTVLFGKGTMI